MPTFTPVRDIEEVPNASNNPEKYVNPAARRLEHSSFFVAKDKDLIAPPGSPAEGDAYYILDGTTPTGAWAGKAGYMPNYVNGAWEFNKTRNGDHFYFQDEKLLYKKEGGVLQATNRQDFIDSVLLATTANITLSGEQTIDGVLTSSSRVLVKSQSTGSQNGIYLSAAGAWTRTTDFNDAGDVTSGCMVPVEQGTVNGDMLYMLTTNNPITVGSTTLTFTRVGGIGALFNIVEDTTPQLGGDLDGNTFEIILTNNKGFKGKTAAAVTKGLVIITASDIATFGDASIASAILGSALTITPNTTISGTLLSADITISGSAPNLNVGNSGLSTGNAIIELGARTGDGASIFDFHSQNGGDYDTRLVQNSGANGSFDILHLGTGTLNISAVNAAPVSINTTNTIRVYVQAGGIVNNISDLTVGRAAGSGTGARLTVADNSDARSVIDCFSENDAYTNNIAYQGANAAAGTGWHFLLGQSDINGTPDTEYKIRGDGEAFIDGAWTGGGADDSTLLEWLDGNPQHENRVGLSVLLVGDKIRSSIDTDNPADIIGLVSSNPSSVGNCPINWPGKFEKNELGGYRMQDYKVYKWDEVVPAVTKIEKRQLKLKVKKPVQCVNIIDGKAVYTIEEKEVLEPQYTTFLLVDPDGKPVLNKIAEAVLDKEGKEIAPARYEQATYKEPVPEDYVVVVEPEKTICHCHADYKMPEGVVPPPDAKVTVQQRRILSENYDPSQKYEIRLDRALAHKEWAIVGRNGQVPIRKGQPVKSTWKLMREISDTVGLWLID